MAATYCRPSINPPNTSNHLEWVSVNRGFHFSIFLLMLLLFVFTKICEIDRNCNDIIPGIYKSGALISYLGATGSVLLY